jgi:hypothetical protein
MFLYQGVGLGRKQVPWWRQSGLIGRKRKESYQIKDMGYGDIVYNLLNAVKETDDKMSRFDPRHTSRWQM